MPPSPARYRAIGSARRTGRALWNILPVILGVLLLASLVVQLLPKVLAAGLFGIDPRLDTLLAALIGSIAAAQPVVSYLFGGELLTAGVNLMAVTALIITWVTVGIVPLPAEAAALGWRFALWRNLVAFVAAIFISLVSVGSLHALGG